MTGTVTRRMVARLELNDRVCFVVDGPGEQRLHPVCEDHRRAGEGRVSIVEALRWICPECLAVMTGQWDRDRFAEFTDEAGR